MPTQVMATGLDGRRTFEIPLDVAHDQQLEIVIGQFVNALLTITGYNNPEQCRFLNLMYLEPENKWCLVVREVRPGSISLRP